MRVLVLISATLLSAPVLSAENSYVCVADNAAGFEFNASSNAWESADIRPDQIKYIVRPLPVNGERYKLGYRSVVRDVNGDGIEVALCRLGSDVYGSLNCGEPRDPYNFSLRKETMRFVVSFNGSYLTSNREIFVEDSEVTVKKVPDKGGSKPFIAIGHCSPL